MLPPIHSPRVTVLITELNRRGLQGPVAKLFVRKYAQQRIARQIDYYDHEVAFRAGLPLWAASPWLARRIRRDAPAPEGYFPSSQSVAMFLRVVPYRPSREDQQRPLHGRLIRLAPRAPT